MEKKQVTLIEIIGAKEVERLQLALRVDELETEVKMAKDAIRNLVEQLKASKENSDGVVLEGLSSIIEDAD